MNKCTLLIDGNWLLQSRFFVLNKGFDMSSPDNVKQAASEELTELMARSISIVLNRFNHIDNFILVADGGSWRKKLPVPEQLLDTTYKGNRKQDRQFDWHYIYMSLNKLVDHCKELGITVSQHDSIEGDDWIWYWSRRLNAEGINTIIWSVDNDLKQLIQVDANTNAFTVWYNDKNGLYIPNILEAPNDPLEFFMQPEYYSPMLEELKMYSPKVSYIDPNTIITSKIICGDSGDNIKSVLRYKKNNRTYRVTEKEWSKFAKELGITTINDLIRHKEEIAKMIGRCDKYSTAGDPKTLSNNVLEMIDYNIKLVWLNEAVIPDTATTAMNQVEYKQYDVPYIRSNYKVLAGVDDTSDIEKLFEEES